MAAAAAAFDAEELGRWLEEEDWEENAAAAPRAAALRARPAVADAAALGRSWLRRTDAASMIQAKDAVERDATVVCDDDDLGALFDTGDDFL